MRQMFLDLDLRRGSGAPCREGDRTMNKTWIFLLTLVGIVLLASVPTVLPMNKAGRVQYLETIPVPGATPADLMQRGRLWLAQRGQSGEDVTPGDQPHCIMVADSFQISHPGMPITVFYTLAFETRGPELCATIGAMRVFDGSVERPIEYYLNKDGEPKVNPWLAESVDQQARALLADLRETVTSAKAGAKARN